MTPDQRATVERFAEKARALYTSDTSRCLRALLTAYDSVCDELARLTTPRPFAEWHEGDGPALWWSRTEGGEPYVGGPTDCDWRDFHDVTEDDGEDDLFWTPIPNPRFPR